MKLLMLIPAANYLYCVSGQFFIENSADAI